MMKVTVSEEAKCGVECEVNGVKFMAGAEGDVEDCADGWNEGPGALLVVEWYELMAKKEAAAEAVFCYLRRYVEE